MTSYVIVSCYKTLTVATVRPTATITVERALRCQIFENVNAKSWRIMRIHCLIMWAMLKVRPGNAQGDEISNDGLYSSFCF